MKITVEVFDGTEPAISIAALSSSFRHGWLDQLNDVGSGTFSIHVTDEDLAANPTLKRYGNIARFSLDGVEQFAAIIEARACPPAPPGEDAERIWTFAGRGVLALLEDAVVYPEATVSGSKLRQRFFDFTAISYDESDWIAANETHRQDDSAGGYAGYPLEWPDPTAFWIWSREASLVDVPVGSSFFRKAFTLAADTTVAVFATADDDFRLWLDGEEVLSNWLLTHQPYWQQTFRVNLDLTAGTHQIAVQAANSAGPVPNPASFIASIMEIDPNEVDKLTGTVFVHTDDTWVCLDYPENVPGSTIGRVLRILIEEGQARGALEGITLDFDDLIDSKGASWDEQPDVAIDIGTNYLDVIRTFVEQWVDAEMSPTLELRVYNKGTLGTDLTGSVELVVGEDFEEEDAQGKAALTNAVLARATTGELTTREDAASLGTNKRKETYLEMALAPTMARAEAMSDEVFVEFAQPTAEISAKVTTGPYTAYGTGDTILAPGPDSTAVETTVLAIVVGEDPENGRTTFAVQGMQEDAAS
jgi:hypothetical protein